MCSELVLPEPCFGWILCFKKEEFWFLDTCFIGEKGEKNRPVLRPKNERTDRHETYFCRKQRCFSWSQKSVCF